MASKILLVMAKTEGLKQAAELLRVHQSSWARRVIALGEYLAIKLVGRLPKGCRLTLKEKSGYVRLRKLSKVLMPLPWASGQ